jgi:predicted hydrocarbon binding protein
MDESGLDMEKGLIYVVEGLMRGIEEDFGKERAREVLLAKGYETGEKAGRRFGPTTPEEAIRKVIDRLSPYLKIKIADVEKKPGLLTVTIQLKGCVVRKALMDRGISYPSTVCRLMWGYTEGALNTMTGMKSKVVVYASSLSETCVGTITLEGGASLFEGTRGATLTGEEREVQKL